MPLDEDVLQRGAKLPKQNEIIKAAGNMAYPMGLRTERLAHEILGLARMYGLPFETVIPCWEPPLKKACQCW